MGKIFVFIGPSCSGKDTIFKNITNENNLKPIVLYTTRPKRDKEIDGITYNFITDQELKEMDNNNEIIEKREYNTIYGIWTYATCSKSIDLDNNNYAIINTLEGYKKLKEYYGSDTVIPLYISVSKKIRLERAINREMKQKEPKYEELCRRFLADSKDFSNEKLIEAGIIKTYNNDNSIDIVIDEINQTINNELKNTKQKKKII